MLLRRMRRWLLGKSGEDLAILPLGLGEGKTAGVAAFLDFARDNH